MGGGGSRWLSARKRLVWMEIGNSQDRGARRVG